MEVKIIVESLKNNLTLKLFGARHNQLLMNFGNHSQIEFRGIQFSKEYREAIGLNDDDILDHPIMIHPFLVDLVKYNFRVLSINRKPLVVEGKEISKLNPYLYSYEIHLQERGFYSFVIELEKI